MDLDEDQQRVFNFGVYLHTKSRKVQRRILQLDFDDRVLCNVRKGAREQRYDFSDLSHTESNDEAAFTIHFVRDMHPAMEYDAETVEDKNRVLRLINFIVDQNKNRIDKTIRAGDLVDKPSVVVKEGILEKRGHSMMSLLWGKRFVRVSQGQLAYYQPNDTENALDIIQLDLSVVSISKTKSGFVLRSDRGREHAFKVPSDSPDQTRERDEWLRALLSGSSVTRGAVDPEQERLTSQVTGIMTAMQAQLRTLADTMELRGEGTSPLSLQINELMRTATFLNASVSRAYNSAQRPAATPIKGVPTTTAPTTSSSDPKRSTGVRFDTVNDPTPPTIITTAPASGDGSGDAALASTIPDAEGDDDNREGAGERKSGRPMSILGVKDRVLSVTIDNHLIDLPVEEGFTVPEPGSKEEDSLVHRVSQAFDEMAMTGVPMAPPMPGSATPFDIPPPPPPGMDSEPSIDDKPKVVPRCKLRPLHWTKLGRYAAKKMFWADVHEDRLQLATDMLEELFGVEEETDAFSLQKAKSQRKSLLPLKRAENIGVWLAGASMQQRSVGGMRMGPPGAASAAGGGGGGGSVDAGKNLFLDRLDERLSMVGDEAAGGLSMDTLLTLRRFSPDETERDLFAKYTGNRNELSVADQFVAALTDIPCLRPRIDLLVTLREFPSSIEDLMPQVDSSLKASIEMETNWRFAKMLEYVLAIGNYINGNTARGQAHGVHLKSLVKLADTKAKGRKHSLVDFLIMTLRDQADDLLEWPAAFRCLPSASEFSIKAISAEVELLKRDLDKLRRTIKQLSSMENSPIVKNSRFLKELDQLITSHEATVTALDVKSAEMNKHFKAAASRFCDKQNIDSDEMFAPVMRFIDVYSRALTRAKAEQLVRTNKVVKGTVIPRPQTLVSPWKDVQLRSSEASSFADDAASDDVEPSANDAARAAVQSVMKGADVPGGRAGPPVAPKRSKNKTPSVRLSTQPGVPTIVEGADPATAVSSAGVWDDAPEDDGDATALAGTMVAPAVVATSSSADVWGDVEGTSSTANKAPAPAPPPPKRTNRPISVSGAQVLSMSTPSSSLFDEITAPECSGYMDKKSGGKKVTSKWDTRFFQLVKGRMTYYKREGVGKESGDFLVQGAYFWVTASRGGGRSTVSDASAAATECSVTIHVDTHKRVYQLKPYAETDLQMWRSALLAHGALERVGDPHASSIA